MNVYAKIDMCSTKRLESQKTTQCKRNRAYRIGRDDADFRHDSCDSRRRCEVIEGVENLEARPILKYKLISWFDQWERRELVSNRS